jgi:hypothetical protein
MPRRTFSPVSVLMLAASFHNAHPHGHVSADCKGYEVALSQERIARASLESELAALRPRLDLEAKKNAVGPQVKAPLVVVLVRRELQSQDPSVRPSAASCSTSP